MVALQEHISKELSNGQHRPGSDFEPLASTLTRTFGQLPYQLSRAIGQLTRIRRRPRPERTPVPYSQKQTRLTPAQRIALTAAYVEGAAVDDLSARFAVHRSTVREILREAGVLRSPCLRQLTDNDVQAAAELYRQGNSLRTLAAQFGVDSTTVRRELLRVGVKMRPRRGK